MDVGGLEQAELELVVVGILPDGSSKAKKMGWKLGAYIRTVVIMMD